MKVIFNKIEWTWKDGDSFAHKSLLVNCPDWKIHLRGIGSGICRMVCIKDVELIPHHHKIKTPSD